MKESIEVRELPYRQFREELRGSRTADTALTRAADLEAAYADGMRRGRAAWLISFIIGAALGSAVSTLVFW